MKTITANRAQKICSNWHDGQWSALYQFSSSGIYSNANALRYLQEIETSLHPEYNLHPGELTKTNQQELEKLKRYFNTHGLAVEYKSHPVYGYLIPYLKEDNKEVTQLKYLI